MIIFIFFRNRQILCISKGITSLSNLLGKKSLPHWSYAITSSAKLLRAINQLEVNCVITLWGLESGQSFFMMGEYHLWWPWMVFIPCSRQQQLPTFSNELQNMFVALKVKATLLPIGLADDICVSFRNKKILWPIFKAKVRRTVLLHISYVTTWDSGVYETFYNRLNNKVLLNFKKV